MLEGASAETRSERFETATKINRSALAWLDRNPGKKFFAYLHYRDVHGPYVPPPPYHRLYWNGREAKANRTKLRRITREEYALMQGYMHLGDDHRVLEYYVSQYDGAIRYTDEQIKVLLAELEKRGLLANTVLFLTADHGEAFLDHGTWAHGRGLYQEEVHVPLVLVDFRSKAAAGRRIDLPVQTLDIYPTILEMLKAPIPPGVQGVSLFDAIEGKEGSAKRAVFHQSRRQDAVRIGQWKAIHDFATKTMELYHLGKDPQEKQNLAQSEPEKAADLLAELGGFWNRNATHPAVSVAEEKELDSKTAEELKALGYIQ
jgi:arylsulfatase A-like enzyme